MCKAPELGKVKTRLAASVGDEAALRVYSAMFKHVLLRTADAPCEFVICFDGNEDVLPHSEYIAIRQRGTDLGERICNAVEDVGSFDTCVVIGTDAPFLDADTLRNTFRQLSSTDVVVGPSVDGGYYLIGFNTVNNRLFDQITWSSDRVLLETRERCTELGLRAELLPPMIDVDTLGDIVMLQAPSHDHGEIVTRLRALIATLLILVCCTVPSLADGGWISEQGQLLSKVGFQTLGTTSAYDLDGVKTTIPKYSIWSVSLYAEYGLMKDLMLVLNAPHSDISRQATNEESPELRVAPNPLYEFAEIRYTLWQDGIADVEIYDAIGHKLLTIIEGSFHVAGTYTIALRRAGIASGAYLCVLRSGSFVVTQPLVVR